MEIRIAGREDMRALAQYDRHIPACRLAGCVAQGQVYALWEGKQLVGVLRYSLFWQTIPFLDLLYLSDTHRGKGYGRQAMDHWEKQMGKLGYTHVMLSTQADETAKDFYEKLGYRRIGAFLPPEQEADEIVYCKQLER